MKKGNNFTASFSELLRNEASPEWVIHGHLLVQKRHVGNTKGMFSSFEPKELAMLYFQTVFLLDKWDQGRTSRNDDNSTVAEEKSCTSWHRQSPTYLLFIPLPISYGRGNMVLAIPSAWPWCWPLCKQGTSVAALTMPSSSHLAKSLRHLNARPFIVLDVD